MSIGAVFDCMIFLQAAANPAGPAMACFLRMDNQNGPADQSKTLFVNHDVLAEVGEVLLRPELRRKLRNLTPEAVGEFLDRVRANAILVESVPNAFPLPRDPKDEPYLNLAIAAQAEYLVTWNAKHLTYLMDGTTPESIQFLKRFPKLQIVDPLTFLRDVS